MRFDTILVVDWSAALARPKRPTKDAIWIGAVSDGQVEEPVYIRSRLDAEGWLQSRLDTETAEGRRVLATFDFPFGYPAGFARAVTGSDNPFAVWDWLEARITDDAAGRNNRFDVAEAINAMFPAPGPFWGKHDRNANPGIPYKKETVRFERFNERRTADLAAKAASSCFQLAFPPTVGGQVLMGLPVLNRLRRRAGVAVWPFQPITDAQIVLAEIWPSLVDNAVKRAGDTIRDRSQVRLLAQALSRLSSEELAEWMDVPEIAREEAWILGAGKRDRLDALLQSEAVTPDPNPPRLKNDCFALPPGVDWTPVDEALARLRARLHPVVEARRLAVENADGLYLAEDVIAARSNPPAPNAAVDGYGFAHAALPDGDAVLPLLSGRAAAGAPFDGKVPAGAALRILTGAVLPPGVDTVVLEEDCTVENDKVAFAGSIKLRANTRNAGEDVEAGAVALTKGTRIGAPERALLAAVGVTQVSVWRRLRVGVLSTGDEIVAPGSTDDPGKTYDANRPMLLSILTDWGLDAVDLGHAADNRDVLRARLDDAAAHVDAILTSGGASAGDEDHVSALLGETGSRADWRIALKPGRPLCLGVWLGVPVFGLPGNPVAALVCTMIFARPAFTKLGGGGWREPLGFTVPVAFEKRKKPGRREYLRARIGPDGRADVFKSEGSGRISGLAWADGLVELDDGERHIRPGDMVRYLPFSGFR